MTMWQSIQSAPDDVRDAASVTLMEPGRSRARLYHGPDRSLYGLWNGGDAGTPATLWCQLPDVPIEPVPDPQTTVTTCDHSVLGKPPNAQEGIRFAMCPACRDILIGEKNAWSPTRAGKLPPDGDLFETVLRTVMSYKPNA
jgi:hypothetical protein